MPTAESVGGEDSPVSPAVQVESNAYNCGELFRSCELYRDWGPVPAVSVIVDPA